ncbi:hypothetical protein BDZ94DRAFT_298439 [Collybia nuda]|uniref:Uncharacterized protein n=1 Tax=Collybia nuda TaxID=64659 RepID=A0A9P5YDJ6_9AGAR|nr:hypothetical protein BDZ94DRAFT_298439 [Collybia nuda]
MALIQLKDESMPSSLVIRGITTIGHRQNRGPGVLLHQLYSTIGEQVGKKTDELAQRLGFGPEAVTRRIQEAFGVQEQRLLKLVELHSSSRVARLTLPVTKYCAKLTEYTLRSEAPETRLQAVNCIILLVSLYPGLRQSFIVGKIVQRAGESNEAILKLWEGDEPYSADWEYKRSLAAAFLCEDEIGTLVEATQPEFLGLVDREGSGSVIEKLVSIIDCE